MKKYLGLSEFVGFNPGFRNAINLDLNLNHKEKLQSYIPTKSSKSLAHSSERIRVKLSLTFII